ncbi:cell division control protein 45 [Teratosphaeria destructans]|uniref:Cell division control protein 45 n=1 Tax=Teratosphaeria destructans TaxID=418781 RepID=A0A9W7SX55_9PEZI|nr:cell division control protein 45 [Teratosphaeria destructans]
MYLPRGQIASLYSHLVAATTPSSAPILILTSLTVDALCAVRILTALLKRDFLPHTVVPVSGYAELQDAGERLVQSLRRDRGGAGGTVVCVGCGGGVDVGEVLCGDVAEDAPAADGRGVAVWVLDARRPWNLENVFGGAETGQRGVKEGRLLSTYTPGTGGVIVWDEGDIEEEMAAEREAYFALREMPDISDEDLALSAETQEYEGAEDDEAGAGDGAVSSSSSSRQQSGRKRKASSELSDADDDADDENENERPRQRRRSNRSTPIPSSPGGRPLSFQIPSSQQGDVLDAIMPSSPPAPKPLSLRQQKKQLLKMRRKHEATLQRYYDAGSWTGEPVSSMLYSLASELGREDNELLWLAIVGVESVAMSPFTAAQANKPRLADGSKRVNRLELVKEVLRDEVPRLNPPPIENGRTPHTDPDGIPTHARSPTDSSIRLSPEPRFLLIRHWSLYDSMMHSPYLATRLHVWGEQGRKRLHKLLAKMGISLAEAGKGYLHLDMEIKQTLNKRLVKYAEQYNLNGLVPSAEESNRLSSKGGWGFVRSWGWRGTLSAVDEATIVSAILEVGAETNSFDTTLGRWDNSKQHSYNFRMHRPSLPSPPHSSDSGLDEQTATTNEAPDWTTRRFFAAFDALAPSTSKSTHAGLSTLLHHIPTAQTLARAILRTGSALISKKQIRHLHAFRMAVVKEGPDVPLFTHPGALVKLAAWIAEAVSVLEAEKGHKVGKKGDDALVVSALDEGRSVYVVVGLGAGGVGAGRVRSKAELKEREERKKQRAEAKAAKAAAKARKRDERRQFRRELLAANGDLESDDSAAEESDATESSASSSSASSSDSDSSSTEDETPALRRKKSRGKNRFGPAFQEVVEETGARVRIDSFEHCVVEVRKEDLSGFMEALSGKAVVG